MELFIHIDPSITQKENKTGWVPEEVIAEIIINKNQISKELSNKMTKKKIIKSFENLSPELQDLFRERYPYGYSNNLLRLKNAKNESFFVVPLELEDAQYMVKVKLEKIVKDKEDDEVEEPAEEPANDSDNFGNDDQEEAEGKQDPSFEPNTDDIDF